MGAIDKLSAPAHHRAGRPHRDRRGRLAPRDGSSRVGQRHHPGPFLDDELAARVVVALGCRGRSRPAPGTPAGRTRRGTGRSSRRVRSAASAASAWSGRRRDTARSGHRNCRATERSARACPPTRGRRGAGTPERSPQFGDSRRQRAGEVAVLALAKSDDGHVDRGTEAPLLVIQRTQLVALTRVRDRAERQQPRRHQGQHRLLSQSRTATRHARPPVRIVTCENDRRHGFVRSLPTDATRIHLWRRAMTTTRVRPVDEAQQPGQGIWTRSCRQQPRTSRSDDAGSVTHESAERYGGAPSHRIRGVVSPERSCGP